MERLGSFADEATPVFADLGAQAPAINRFVRQLGPFAQAGIPAFESLGDAAEVGTPAMIAALPITRDLRALAKDVRPVADTASKLLDVAGDDATASSASSTTPSTKWPPSTASTRSGTTCARA